jgi:putative cell wall-binding protein
MTPSRTPTSARLTVLLITVVIALTAGPLTSAIAAPVNDDFADAIEFSLTGPSPLYGSNVGATGEPGEPAYGDISENMNSVWWRFTAPEKGDVTLSTEGTGFDNILTVITGTLASHTVVTWADDELDDTGEQVDFAVTAGTTYHISVLGYDGAEGPITLSFTWTPYVAPGAIRLENPLGTEVTNIDFGTIAVGNNARRTVYVRNVGEGTLTVESVSIEMRSFANGYRVVSDGATGTIPPGGTREVVIEYAPTSSAAGAPNAVPYSGSLAGLPQMLVSRGTGFVIVYTYFRNAGGTGSLAYTAVASNGSTEVGRAHGTEDFLGGHAYAMRTRVATSGATSSEPRLEVSLPLDFDYTHVLRPTPPATMVDAFTGIDYVEFSRLEDAVLVVLSDDPEEQGTEYGYPAGTFVRLFGHSTGGPATGPVERWSGPDRYATAAAVSAKAFPTGADIAFIATGANFPDALAGGPAGGVLEGPILLTDRDALPPATTAELERLKPEKIVILGGSAVVTDTVAGQLAGYAGEVTRWSGANRFATAAAVSANTFPQGAGMVFVATGANFPDALAGGPAGGLQGGPILLTERDTLPPATIAELQRLAPDQIVVLGGAAVVSDTVTNQLKAYAQGGVQRWSGPDRYATAAAVSASTFPNAAATVFVATGANFPDALAGGPAGSMLIGPILLTDRDTLPQATIDELERLGPKRIVILGGSAVITDDVATQLAGYVG